MVEKRLTGCRVLVVEDEWLIALDLVEHLEEAGAIVLGPVSNVPEALETLRTLDQLPDVASLDLKLAEGTSIRIAEELDRLGVPFILAQSARSCDFGQVEERCGNTAVVVDR